MFPDDEQFQTFKKADLNSKNPKNYCNYCKGDIMNELELYIKFVIADRTTSKIDLLFTHSGKKRYFA